MSGQQARRRSRRVEGSLIEIFVGSDEASECLAEGFWAVGADAKSEEFWRLPSSG